VKVSTCNNPPPTYLEARSCGSGPAQLPASLAPGCAKNVMPSTSSNRPNSSLSSGMWGWSPRLSQLPSRPAQHTTPPQQHVVENLHAILLCCHTRCERRMACVHQVPQPCGVLLPSLHTGAQHCVLPRWRSRGSSGRSCNPSVLSHHMHPPGPTTLQGAVSQPVHWGPVLRPVGTACCLVLLQKIKPL
jgi:hypothetical protein